MIALIRFLMLGGKIEYDPQLRVFRLSDKNRKIEIDDRQMFVDTEQSIARAMERFQ